MFNLFGDADPRTWDSVQRVERLKEKIQKTSSLPVKSLDDKEHELFLPSPSREEMTQAGKTYIESKMKGNK